MKANQQKILSDKKWSQLKPHTLARMEYGEPPISESSPITGIIDTNHHRSVVSVIPIIIYHWYHWYQSSSIIGIFDTNYHWSLVSLIPIIIDHWYHWYQSSLITFGTGDSAPMINDTIDHWYFTFWAGTYVKEHLFMQETNHWTMWIYASLVPKIYIFLQSFL